MNKHASALGKLGKGIKKTLKAKERQRRVEAMRKLAQRPRKQSVNKP